MQGLDFVPAAASRETATGISGNCMKVSQLQMLSS